MEDMRDDELWKELIYNLQHPISEEEKRTIKAQEAEKREKILDKIWGKDSCQMIIEGAAPVADYKRKDLKLCIK